MAEMAASLPTVAPSRPRRCCQCKGTAKCLGYACVMSGTSCSCCLPGEFGNCHNTPPGDPPPLTLPSLLSASLSTAAPSCPRRCCRCNGTVKCLRCACVRSDIPCSCCLPGEAGNCRNTLPGGPLALVLPLSSNSLASSIVPCHLCAPASLFVACPSTAGCERLWGV